MSREVYEVSEEAFYLSLLARGNGDPDFFGYKGEDDDNFN